MLGDNRKVSTFKIESFNGITYAEFAAACLEFDTVSNFTSIPLSQKSHTSIQDKVRLAKGDKIKDILLKWRTIYAIFNRQMINSVLNEIGAVSVKAKINNNKLIVTYQNDLDYPISVMPQEMLLKSPSLKHSISSDRMVKSFTIPTKGIYEQVIEMKEDIKISPKEDFQLYINARAYEAPSTLSVLISRMRTHLGDSNLRNAPVGLVILSQRGMTRN